MGRKAKRAKILKRRDRLGKDIDPLSARRLGLGYIIDEKEAKAKRMAELEFIAKAGEEMRKKKAEAARKRKAAQIKKKKEKAAKLKLEEENKKALEVLEKQKPKKRIRRTSKASQ